MHTSGELHVLVAVDELMMMRVGWDLIGVLALLYRKSYPRFSQLRPFPLSRSRVAVHDSNVFVSFGAVCRLCFSHGIGRQERSTEIPSFDGAIDACSFTTLPRRVDTSRSSS